MSVKDQIVAINQKLAEAREAYYVKAEPIMSDAEYDTLEAELRALVDTHPEFISEASVLKTVGSDLNGNGRVKHTRPMLSIENYYTKDEVATWCRQFPVGTVFCVEPKRDGISCEAQYSERLIQALTRGTGTEGEDMTAQFRALKDVPQFIVDSALLDLNTRIAIRGELAMRDSELERINAEAIKTGSKTYSSTRNLTAGTMKQQDLGIVENRQILFLPWDVYASNDALLPDSRAARLKMLEKAGFPKFEGVLVSNPDEIVTAIDKILELNAKSDIRADGVVIKVDSVKLCKEMGVASKFTNYQICFKPQSESGTTYLREVIWQTGRSGKVTPVAVCDPVVLAGAKVERAILNHLSWIEGLGLTIGAKVEMLRSGDVIPQVIKALDTTGSPIVPPTNCSECGSLLVMDTSTGIKTLSCENVNCIARVAGHFEFVGSREILEIDGLASQMANHLVNQEYARNLGELFEFQVEALANLNRVGEDKFISAMNKAGFTAHIVKMVRSMETAKVAPWDKWIAALGIPMIGRTIGKVLATQTQLQSDDMASLPDKITAVVNQGVEGLGPVKSRILLDWASDPMNREICQTLATSGVKPTSVVRKVDAAVGEPLKGVAFIMTGEFPENREMLEQRLVSLGAVLKSSVSKNITHLVVGEAPGQSKLTKYNELVAKGCKIEKVGKEWVAKVLAEAGMPMKDSGIVVEEA